MKQILLCLFLILSIISCQKKLPPDVLSDQNKPPDQPLQRLAWESARQINQRMKSHAAKMGTVENQAKLPETQLHYFRGALENELWRLRPAHDVPAVLINGLLAYANGQLQFLWEIESTPEKISGVAAVLWTPAPPDSSQLHEDHQHPQTDAHQHVEVDIPTPIAQLQIVPLDVAQVCDRKSEVCEVLVLYEDSIERIDWKNGNKRRTFIPPQYFAQVRSRAPSGKILYLEGTCMILHNNLIQPLQYDLNLDQAAPVNLPPQIPRPAPGLNIFFLMNGHFYDFEVLTPKGLAVIQEDQRLSIGAGTLVSSNELVGGALAVVWPTIYTSSNSLPSQKDSLLKFTYDNSSLLLQSTFPVDGEILDLAATDLNRDNSSELLVTVRRNGGIFIDVLEAP